MKDKAGQSREAANLSLEERCILPLNSLLWSIEQGGGTETKREAHPSSLSSLQRDNSYLQLGPKRQKTQLCGILMEHPTSCFRSVLPWPTELREGSRCERTKKSKNEWPQFRRKEVLFFPSLVAQTPGVGGEWRSFSWLGSYRQRFQELTDAIKNWCPPPTFFGELIPDSALAFGVWVLRHLTQMLMGPYPLNQGWTGSEVWGVKQHRIITIKAQAQVKDKSHCHL